MDLENLLNDNNIEIPRLRGVTLCEDMNPWTKQEISEVFSNIEIECCKDLCTSVPFWDPKSGCSEYSEKTDSILEFYLNESGICWDRIHGRKRKILKTYIHNCKKDFLKYVERYNFYCGKKNIIKVHTRMGGYNWSWNDPDWIRKRTEIVESPWFIERVNDWWDSTYCDFYCKIKGEE